MSSDLHTQSIRNLAEALTTKKINALELCDYFLKRINTHDPSLNSFITVDEDTARAQATKADEIIAKGQHNPLTGIPMAHKDIFCTKGIKTSCASKMLDTFIAPYNATVVDLCHKKGLVMLGKTNMDEFAMGSTNETSYYGPTKNPWDLTKVPGGSSGGSASAVSAGLTPFATGTDTGGSIRQPAAFCNITGLKPTYGRVSRFGMVAFASSLDQGGPMAKSAEDCAYFMNALAGFDSKDSTSVNMAVPDYTEHLNDKLAGLKIGIPDAFFDANLDPRIAKKIQEAIDVYKTLGATLKTVELPHNKYATAAYYVIAPAECSSNLARYDGVRYGHRCENPKDLDDLYARSRNEGFGAEVTRRIMMGTYALSSGYYDACYHKAQQVRRLIFNDYQAAFEDVDVIMGPTSPCLPFNIGEKIDDPVSLYLQDIYTLSVNLAGLPAISLPAGTIESLPIGLQIIGKPFSEANLLNIAHAYQRETQWHTQLPANF